MNRPSSGRRLTLVAAAASLLLLAGCGERQTTEPVASMAASPLANICCAGSTAVPVALSWKYGMSSW